MWLFIASLFVLAKMRSNQDVLQEENGMLVSFLIAMTECLTYTKEEKIYFAHGFRGFSPYRLCPMVTQDITAAGSWGRDLLTLWWAGSRENPAFMGFFFFLLSFCPGLQPMECCCPHSG
jgi:hypothetical protein